jgi:hypothetical protein
VSLIHVCAFRAIDKPVFGGSDEARHESIGLTRWSLLLRLLPTPIRSYYVIKSIYLYTITPTFRGHFDYLLRLF